MNFSFADKKRQLCKKVKNQVLETNFVCADTKTKFPKGITDDQSPVSPVQLITVVSAICCLYSWHLVTQKLTIVDYIIAELGRVKLIFNRQTVLLFMQSWKVTLFFYFSCKQLRVFQPALPNTSSAITKNNLIPTCMGEDQLAELDCQATEKGVGAVIKKNESLKHYIIFK